MNAVLKIGLGVGALVVVSRMLQLNKLAANVSVSLAKIRIHKVDLSGITIAAIVYLKNYFQSILCRKHSVVTRRIRFIVQ